MTPQERIEDILKLVHEGEFTRAVDSWRAQSLQNGKCATCFYESLPNAIRCAKCLDGHVCAAELHRTYSHISRQDLTLARQHLKVWLGH